LSADPQAAVPDPEAGFAPVLAGGWTPTKVTTMAAALAGSGDGDLIALGGMTLFRRPVAAAAELIRRGLRDLTLIDYTGGFEGDILIGAGCVAKVRSCYFGLDVLGLAPMHRQALAAGEIELVDESEVTLALALRAARAHVDFMPARIFDGTGFPVPGSRLERVRSPFSGREYVAVPALTPDLAIVHATVADAAGNAFLGSDYGLDADLAATARTTVLTTERLVETADLGDGDVDILGASVDHVVLAPRGAYPTACLPDYDVDFGFLADYVEACAEGRFEGYLEDHVL
jgi:glutaconate CoA-transferase subunit A